jgi:hypothetical protein
MGYSVRPPRNDPKPKTQGALNKKSDVPTYLLFLRFFKIFSSDLENTFYGILKLLMQKNGQKHERNQIWGNRTGKVSFLNFFGKRF